MNHKARALTAVVFALMVLITAWLAGFNFDERGETASMVFLLSSGFSALGYGCPLFDRS